MAVAKISCIYLKKINNKNENEIYAFQKIWNILLSNLISEKIHVVSTKCDNSNANTAMKQKRLNKKQYHN